VLGVWITVGIAALAGYGLFCRVEGREPLREFLFELSLRRVTLQELDAQAARQTRSDLMVGLTTIPSRLPFLLPTLKSLLSQEVLPEKIVLHIPLESRREGTRYELPTELMNLQMVEIRRCEDTGPATKILPSLMESHPDQRIVAVDDDRLYRPTFLKRLVDASEQNPDAAVGCMGLKVPLNRVDDRKGFLGRTLDGLRFQPGVSLRGSRLSDQPMEVDILHGYGGFLVRPRFFDLDTLGDMKEAPEAAWMEDDTWFAAHCHAPKLIVPGRPDSFPRYFHRRVFSRSRLGLHNRGGADPTLRNTSILMGMYSHRWTR
jgi:hypothetical protein